MHSCYNYTHVFIFCSKMQCSHHAEVMQAIHNLAVSMEKKMDALMSAVSEIRRKQNHLNLALEMQQVSQPMCSTPGRNTPWYMSDSFTDHTPKPAPPTTSSEAAFMTPSSAVTMPATKSTPTASREEAMATTSTASTKAAPETTPTTKAATKTTRKKVDDDSDLLTIPIDPGVLLRLRYISASRQNFATNVMHKLFTRAERETSNVNGVLGKSALDRDKVDYIKSVTFKMYPLEQKETNESAWAKCRGAIDEANRRLYRPK